MIYPNDCASFVWVGGSDDRYCSNCCSYSHNMDECPYVHSK
jgi:hypothetical protein